MRSHFEEAAWSTGMEAKQCIPTHATQCITPQKGLSDGKVKR